MSNISLSTKQLHTLIKKCIFHVTGDTPDETYDLAYDLERWDISEDENLQKFITHCLAAPHIICTERFHHTNDESLCGDKIAKLNSEITELESDTYKYDIGYNDGKNYFMDKINEVYNSL